MRSESEQQQRLDSPEHRELVILSEVDDAPDVTQRQLSSRVGIALGLTNVLLKTLVSRGYVKVSQASWKRRLYTLTPDGFSHRLRLMTSYVHSFLDHYQNVRQTLRDQLEPLALNSESRIAICRTGQFAELVFLALKEIGIEEIDFFDEKTLGSSRFLGTTVKNISQMQPSQYDRIVIASVGIIDPLKQMLVDRGLDPEQLVTFFADNTSKSRIK